MFLSRPARAQTAKPLSARTLLALLFACAAMACTVETASAVPRALPQLKGSVQAKGVVTFDGTGFTVMDVQLVRGSTLYFSNPRNGTLDLRIVTWRGKPVKNLLVRPHARAAWTPLHYGVYDYFDANTTQFGSVTVPGSYGEKVRQVVARKGSPSFPAPAYGVAVVTNAAGGGIPLSSSYGPMEVPGHTSLTGMHHHRFMNDPPWLEVTGGTMTFKPWVLVVPAGQRIHVYNSDAMNHVFFPSVFPVMEVNHGRVSWYRHSFLNYDVPMSGGHITIRFYSPGVYHIVCILHAHAWKHTYKPYRTYGGYPYVMDAIVVVEPRVMPGMPGMPGMSQMQNHHGASLRMVLQRVVQ